MTSDRTSTPKVQHPLIRTASPTEQAPGPACSCQQKRGDDVRWLAMLVRQGLKLIVVGIEKRYRIDDKGDPRKQVA